MDATSLFREHLIVSRGARYPFVRSILAFLVAVSPFLVPKCVLGAALMVGPAAQVGIHTVTRLTRIPQPEEPGDASQLELIGLSANHRYVAFEQYGVVDGGPVFYSTITIVDLAGNTWAASPVDVRVEGDDGSLQAVRAESRASAAPQFARFRISQSGVSIVDDRGSMLDAPALQLLVDHRITDTGVDPHVVEFSVGLPGAGQYHELFRLTLVERDAGRECDYFGPARIMSLDVARIATAGAAATGAVTLQHDEGLPDSRGCVLGYRIARVYVVGSNTVLVFLNISLPGFEGHRVRFIAVSGKLPDN